MGSDLRLAAVIFIDVFQHFPGVLESHGVDIVQSEMNGSQLRRENTVAENVFCEYDAARAENRDFYHICLLPYIDF